MIIVAILKHVAGKSADYGATLDYLKYEHDEVLKKPLLDANGNWVLRRDILLEGINCEPELFDVECENFKRRKISCATPLLLRRRKQNLLKNSAACSKPNPTFW